jgi:hypothetical protein
MRNDRPSDSPVASTFGAGRPAAASAQDGRLPPCGRLGPGSETVNAQCVWGAVGCLKPPDPCVPATGDRRGPERCGPINIAQEGGRVGAGVGSFNRHRRSAKQLLQTFDRLAQGIM